MLIVSGQTGRFDWFGEPQSDMHLKRRAVRGAATVLFGNFFNQLLSVGGLMVLARLLTPADFGLVAMVAALIGIAEVVQDMGLPAATLRFPRITRQQVSNLFWINFAVCVVITLLAMACAPLVERYFDDPRTRAATLWMAFGFLLNGAASQHMALLRRAMRFAEVARIRTLALAVSTVVSIVLAHLEAGFWALIAGNLAAGVTNLLLAWFYCDWRPGAPRRDPGTAAIARFGASLMGFGILGYLARNLHSLIIGRLWGAADAGLFARAIAVRTRLAGNLVESLGLVAPAALARLSEEPDRYCAYYYSGCTAATMSAVPLVFVTAVLPFELIDILLGAGWVRSAELLQILSVAILPQIICNTTGWVYLSRGQASRMMAWGVFGWGALIVGTIVGARFGLRGMAVSVSATFVALLLPCLLYAYRGTPLRVATLFARLTAPLLAGLLAGLVAWVALQMAPPMGSLARLGAGTIAFGMLYLLLLLTVFGQRALISDILRQLLRRDAPNTHPST